MNTKVVFYATVVAIFCGICDASYTVCESPTGSIVSLTISNCGSQKKCPLKKGTNATMEIEFTPASASNNLTAVVHGVILVPVKFDIPNPDGCKDSGVECPIEADKTYKYTTTMPILSTYPRITLDIKWELQGDDKKDIICALIPAKIV